MPKHRFRRAARASALVLAFLIGVVANGTASSARDGSVVLGATTASTNLDRDNVNIGPNNGRFDALRVDVRDSDVFIESLHVTSYEGAEETFRIGRVVREGRSLEPIPLHGRLRSVRDVLFTYKAVGPYGRGGTVTLVGLRGDRLEGGHHDGGHPREPDVDPRYDPRHDPRQDPRHDPRYDPSTFDKGVDRARYERIGLETADNRADSLSFRAERGEGRLRQIRLRAVAERIRIGTVTIVFANGERQTALVNRRLEPGETTEPIRIDLDRDRRRVDEIIVEKRPGLRPGRVELELLGVRDARGDGDRRDDDRGDGYGSSEDGRPRGGWVLFGSQRVGFNADRDTVRVGRDAGIFKKIALRVLENDIFLREVIVVFANGETQRVRVNVELKEGFRTAPLPLDGGDRFIDRIELVYQSKPGGRRLPAVVEVWGDYADRWIDDASRRRDRSDGWLMLGAQRAELLSPDSDVFEVGKRFGTFRAIRIVSRNRPVVVHGLRVVYGNGSVEDVPIRIELRDGQSTEPLDLSGRGRFIERIELRYRTKLNLRGEGTVEVWGLH